MADPTILADIVIVDDRTHQGELQYLVALSGDRQRWYPLHTLESRVAPVFLQKAIADFYFEETKYTPVIRHLWPLEACQQCKSKKERCDEHKECSNPLKESDCQKTQNLQKDHIIECQMWGEVFSGNPNTRNITLAELKQLGRLTSSLANQQPLCQSCNLKKATKVRAAIAERASSLENPPPFSLEPLLQQQWKRTLDHLIEEALILESPPLLCLREMYTILNPGKNFGEYIVSMAGVMVTEYKMSNYYYQEIRDLLGRLLIWCTRLKLRTPFKELYFAPITANDGLAVCQAIKLGWGEDVIEILINSPERLSFFLANETRARHLISTILELPCSKEEYMLSLLKPLYQRDSREPSVRNSAYAEIPERIKALVFPSRTDTAPEPNNN